MVDLLGGQRLFDTNSLKVATCFCVSQEGKVVVVEFIRIDYVEKSGNPRA